MGPAGGAKGGGGWEEPRAADVLRRALRRTERAGGGGAGAVPDPEACRAALLTLCASIDALEAAGAASFRVRRKRVAVTGGDGEAPSAAPPLRLSALVRRYWFLCLSPGSGAGVTSLEGLRRAAVAGGRTPGDVPEGTGRYAAELFAAEVGVQDIFSHRLVRGSELLAAYGDRSVVNCMTGARGPDLYARNPGAVGLLLVEGAGGRLVGRALVWQTVDGGTLLDRVHPENQGDHVRYARYVARAQGWSVASGEPARGHHACQNLQGSGLLYRLCVALLGAPEGGGAEAPAPSFAVKLHVVRPSSPNPMVGFRVYLDAPEGDAEAPAPSLAVKLHAGPRYPIFDTFMYGSRPDAQGDVVLSTVPGEGLALIDGRWVQQAEAAYVNRCAAGLEPSDVY